MKRILQATTLFLFFAASAQAHLIGPTQIAQGSNSDASTEITVIEAWNPSLTPLTYLARFEYGKDAAGEDSPLVSDGTFLGTYSAFFTVGDYSGNPAQVDVSWNLTGTGYGLYAVAVKTADTYLNVYTVSDDQKLIGVDDSVLSPAIVTGNGTVKTGASVSHITFFGKATSVPDSGATLVFLGFGIIGLWVFRKYSHRSLA